MIGVNMMKKILSVMFCMLIIAMTAMPAFADEATVINEVRLSITEPAVGEAPDKNIIPAEPDKYTVQYGYWLKRLYSNDPVEVFEAGYEYALVFYLYPKDGYKFAATEKDKNGTAFSTTVVYMNDQPTEYCIYESETKLGRAYVVSLPAEEEKPVSFFSELSMQSRVSLQRLPLSLKSCSG